MFESLMTAYPLEYKLASVVFYGVIFTAVAFVLRKIAPRVFDRLTFGLFSDEVPKEILSLQIMDMQADIHRLTQVVTNSASHGNLYSTISRGMSSDNAVGGDINITPPDQPQDPVDERPAWIDLEVLVAQQIAAKISSSTSSSSIADLIQLRQSILNQETWQSDRDKFERVNQTLLENAVTIRNRVFTLFAGVNFWLILCVAVTAFVNKWEVPGTIIQAVLGLYVSMSIFLVYVYRNSSARISVILAQREDQTHRHEVADYLQRARPQGPTTDKDIELVKLLLQNHAERESGSEHPYELVLKGITNSTVMLKGGKVVTGK